MSTPERPKLVISFDDDPAEATAAAPPVSPPPTAPPMGPPSPALPPVAGMAPRQVVQPAAQATSSPGITLNDFGVGSVQGRSLVAATAAIVVGWALTEITGVPRLTATTKAGANFHAGVWVGLLGLVFAIVYTGWEQIEARDGEGLLLRVRQAGPWGAGLGFVAGFLASVIFQALLVQAFKNGSHTLLYVARGLGWGIFGLGMGATTAVVVRAREKLVNGALGGVVGGTLGGLLFEYVSEHVHSETMSRLIGLLVIGAGIGLAIGFVETLRREAWLRVVGGGMTGKEFVLYEIETPVGSSPKCGVMLIKDPAIAPFHFVIRTEGGHGRRTITPYEGAAVAINGTPVTHHVLRSGDAIAVGATTIAYSERTI